ncbi:MAG: hypothetical protein HMLKMBBP_02116 [Planctomycetes bacterium]|nr:hypothetical protein [Planctomycetota bacterium]
MPRRDLDDSVDRRAAAEFLSEAAERVLLGRGGSPPSAGSDFLEVARREIERLRAEARSEWFGHLNSWDLLGSRTERARRLKPAGRVPRRAEAEAACQESFVLRGLEGLLRRRGVGLEFLEYVYRSASLPGGPRWLPLAIEGSGATKHLPHGAVLVRRPERAGYDDRFATNPRCVRFGRHAPQDAVLSTAKSHWRMRDENWPDRPERGPLPEPWLMHPEKVDCWRLTIAALRKHGRPCRGGSLETNVAELARLVAAEAALQRVPAVDRRTFSRWFNAHWAHVVIGVDGPAAAK